jgi:hypothetical protein
MMQKDFVKSTYNSVKIGIKKFHNKKKNDNNKNKNKKSNNKDVKLKLKNDKLSSNKNNFKLFFKKNNNLIIDYDDDDKINENEKNEGFEKSKKKFLERKVPISLLNKTFIYTRNSDEIDEILKEKNEESEKNLYENNSSNFKETNELNDNNNEKYKLEDDEKISISSIIINVLDDEEKSLTNNEENENSIIEKQIIPLSTNQINESSALKIRHIELNESVPKYKNSELEQTKVRIKTDFLEKNNLSIKDDEIIMNAFGVYPTILIQDENKIVKQEVMVKYNKKLIDIDYNNNFIKENEESKKNLCKTHQNNFISSGFKETNKGLDDNNNEELRSDSVEFDGDKKISANNIINGSNNEKTLLVNNEKNDESIIEEQITLLSVNQVDDKSGASEIRYVNKSNGFVSEYSNLKPERSSASIEIDPPISTAFLEKNNLHIKGNINSNQKSNFNNKMTYKSGSQYKKKPVAKYEEMMKNKKKLTLQNCTIPKRLVRGICLICRLPLEATDWCKPCQAERFKRNFKNWTSGNSEIDKLIQDSQLDATDSLSYLEWIDHKEITNIEYITKGGFGKIFKGMWIEGPKLQYSTERRIWENIPNTTIALKELDNQKDFNQFLDEVIFYEFSLLVINCY